MSPYHRVRLSFAFAGITLMLGGAYLWRRGGVTLPWTYQGFAIPLPIHFALLAVGILLTFTPHIVVSVLIFLLPDRPKSPLPKLLEMLTTEPEPTALPPNATATQVADHVQQTYKRHLRRLYGALFIFAAVLFIALPLVITDQMSKTQFRHHSEQLVELVQQLPLDYNSADHIRAVLRETKPSVESFPDTAAAKLHRLLSDLYAPNVNSPKDFDASLVNAYQKYVRALAPNGANTIPASAFAISSHDAIESSSVLAAYLTTLAVICDEQGNQGEFLPPYLFARQLLTAACGAIKSKPLAVTSNAQGVTYSALLRRYDEYVGLFNKRHAGPPVAGGDEDSPLQYVTLARLADDAFSAAVASNTNNFNRSRHLNNRSDLRMWLIHYAHIQKKPLVSQDEGERLFLRTEVDPPPQDQPEWKPPEIARILQQLRQDVERAFNLSPDARILVTHAQLLSLTGQICESYKLDSAPCSNPDGLLKEAIYDVTMARRMGLSFRFFNERRADELFMAWMWARPAGRAALSAS